MGDVWSVRLLEERCSSKRKLCLFALVRSHTFGRLLGSWFGGIGTKGLSKPVDIGFVEYSLHPSTQEN